MTGQLKQQWEGTDDESRVETFRGGASYWLATPWPRAGFCFAAVLALGSVVSVPLLWSNNAGASLGLAALGLALAGYAAAASRWTLTHPQQAGRHLAAASHYNNVRWRDHPVSLACGLAILGFVNGFLRISDGGLAGRFIAGAASAAGVGIIAAFAVWHARRKARHHND